MDSGRWLRLKEIFGQLVDLPAAERDAPLASLCEGDPDLRRDVVSLLAAHDDTSTPFGDDAYGGGTAAASYAGRRFGAYRIVEEIGRGGMGAVFLAERADGEFDRRVALKIVGRTFAGTDMVRRFRRERQILATLNHPHIAHLLDGGVSEDGDPFFVMEYVDGLRIDAYAERHALTRDQRLALFVRVCRAVAYAHAQLVIHRDLKPSNILVTQAGDPKLLDFGIARLMDDSGGAEHTITEYRAFTPEYASPEQLRGDRGLTPAADVWSLGVLLEALVTGKAPPRATAGPIAGAVSGPAAAQGMPASGEMLARGRGLPVELQQVLAMCRREEPSRRYRGAGELADDIQRFLDHRPVVAQPDSVAYRAKAFVARRRSTIAASILLMTAVAAGAIAATYARRSDEAGPPAAVAPGRPVRSVAVLPLAAGPGTLGDADRALRVGMADAIVTRLSTVPELAVRPTSATVGYLDAPREPIVAGRDLKVDAVLTGTLQRDADRLQVTVRLIDVGSGSVLWSSSLRSDMANVLRGQQSLATRVTGMLAVRLAFSDASASSPQGSANLEAQDAYLRGALALTTSNRQVDNIFTARDAFEHAIRIDPDFALAYAGLANAYALAGSLTLLAPQDCYPRAERAARRALELDPSLAGAHVALADVEADYNWNWEAAEAHYRQSIALAPNSAGAHFSYAEFLARTGRFAEGSSQSELASRLDPTRVNYLAVRALHYYLEHRFDDAIAQAGRALAQDPQTYLAYLYLAVSHAAKGDVTKGIEAARQAEALTGGAVPDIFVAACNYALMSDRATTERLLARLHALRRTRYVDPFHFVAVHAYLGDTDEAFAWLDRSYRERSYWMTTLKVHPVVDALRGDPRFARMLRHMRLD